MRISAPGEEHEAVDRAVVVDTADGHRHHHLTVRFIRRLDGDREVAGGASLADRQVGRSIVAGGHPEQLDAAGDEDRQPAHHGEDEQRAGAHGPARLRARGGGCAEAALLATAESDVRRCQPPIPSSSLGDRAAHVDALRRAHCAASAMSRSSSASSAAEHVVEQLVVRAQRADVPPAVDLVDRDAGGLVVVERRR